MYAFDVDIDRDRLCSGVQSTAREAAREVERCWFAASIDYAGN